MQRPAHAEEGKQQHGADQTGRAGAKRVDIVQETDGAADLTGAAREISDQQRQGRAHQQRRHDDQRERAGRGRRQAEPDGEDAGLGEDRGREEPERAGQEFDRRQHGQGRKRRPFRQPAAGKTAEPKTEHESGDDNGHQLDIGAEYEKELALPDELIDQRREPREEEQHTQDARAEGKRGVARGRFTGRDQFETCHMRCRGQLRTGAHSRRRPLPPGQSNCVNCAGRTAQNINAKFGVGWEQAVRSLDLLRTINAP